MQKIISFDIHIEDKKEEHQIVLDEILEHMEFIADKHKESGIKIEISKI